MKKRPWEPWEDAILRRHYRKGGSAACVKLLPDRTRASINRRACSLKLRAPDRAVLEALEAPSELATRSAGVRLLVKLWPAKQPAKGMHQLIERHGG